MTDNQKKLLKILEDMFQFDQSDLDFGIYRIMSMKHDEIKKFLYEDLPKQISDGLQLLSAASDNSQLDAIDKQIKETQSAYLSDAIKSAALAELDQKKKALMNKIDLTSVEADVYSHLTNFFSRYYDEGDFISQRRYKEGVYAIPYEGEEVKLHWANADQYYVKTSEYFKNYTFKTNYGDVVHFKLVEADTDKDNNKSNEKRFFQLHNEKPFEILNDELTIYIEYKNGGKKNQKECIAEIVSAFTDVSNNYYAFRGILNTVDGKTLLERQLDRYTARNTFDYFIHKDLEKFLNRELDFYIKNDVVFLDDIEEQNEAKTIEYLTKAKVIRKIAKKIIAFLAQIEEFQKKLFLKKKFVVETNYCITLDRVPKKLYQDVIENNAQINEWKRLFAIDDITSDLTTVGYSEPLTVEFLEQNQFLVLDTAFFPDEFKEKLIDSIDDLDENLDGLMIHSENFQALNILQEKYKEQITCIYIDPPYNTENDTFPYKDGYKHSSWLSMILDRVKISSNLLKYDSGAFLSNIDKNQLFEYKIILDYIFNKSSFVNAIVNVNNPKGRSDQKHLPTAHDNIVFYAADGFVSRGWQPSSKVLKRYNKSDESGMKFREIDLRKTGDADRRIDRENMFYYFHYNESTGDLYPTYEEKAPNGYISIKPMKSENEEGRWRWELNTAKDNISKLFAKFMPVKGQWSVFEKDYLLDDERVFPTSVWDEKPFNSERGTETFIDFGFDKEEFKNPKPVGLMKYLFEHTTKGNDIVIDYFAGSASSGQGIIELNRDDEGNRKYILVEMGEYFDTVTKPRIQKVIYSDEWKDGKPVSRNGSSHAFKYIRLESYEDALNNIKLEKADIDMLGNASEEYLVSYMLNFESKDSDCLLNIERLAKPFDYSMNITRNLETKNRTIDLVETFNYLIGLKVERSYALSTFDADFIQGEHGAINATLKDGTTYKIKMVEGKSLNGESILVIWRELTGDAVKDNAVLDAFFNKKKISTTDFEYKKIYVNGDNNLQNIRTDEENWKVILIEEEMKKKMFENIV